MLPAGFQSAIPPSKWLEAHTLDHVATEISFISSIFAKYIMDKNVVKNMHYQLCQKKK